MFTIMGKYVFKRYSNNILYQIFPSGLIHLLHINCFKVNSNMRKYKQHDIFYNNMVISMEYMNQKELNQFKKDLMEITNELNTDNPLQVIAFANSLKKMGDQIIDNMYIDLITEAYSQEEIEKFQNNSLK